MVFNEYKGSIGKFNVQMPMYSWKFLFFLCWCFTSLLLSYCSEHKQTNHRNVEASKSWINPLLPAHLSDLEKSVSLLRFCCPEAFPPVSVSNHCCISFLDCFVVGQCLLAAALSVSMKWMLVLLSPAENSAVLFLPVLFAWCALVSASWREFHWKLIIWKLLVILKPRITCSLR